MEERDTREDHGREDGKLTRRERGRPTEAKLSNAEVRASQAIYRDSDGGKLKCSLCDSKHKNIVRHLASDRHARALTKFRANFFVRGTTAVCAKCDSPVEWKAVKTHLAFHEVTPWHTPKHVFKRLFSEGTWKSPDNFYCWICESPTGKYWYEALEHCDLESHLKSREGRTLWTLDVAIKGNIWRQWINQGFTPGPDNGLGCRLCEVSVELAHDSYHWESAAHKLNTKRAVKNMFGLEKSFGAGRVSKTPFCDYSTSCDDSTPSCDVAAPSCDVAAPSCDVAAPSCNVPAPSCDVAAPSCDVQAPSSGHEEIPGCAPLFDGTTPSCRNSPLFCATTGSPRARSSTEAMLPPDVNSLDPPNEPDASPIDLPIFIIDRYATKLEECSNVKWLPKLIPLFPLYCVICADPIRDIESARDHVSGRLHAVSMQKYGCENIVLNVAGYYCKCCDERMDLPSLAYCHVLEKEHARRLAARIAEADDEGRSVNGPEVSCDSIIGESRIVAASSLGETLRSLESANARFLKEFTFVIGSHVPKLGKALRKKLNVGRPRGFPLYCVICDDAISGIKSARDHISGRRHVDSLKRYRCEELIETEDGYYCKCCDHKMRRLPLVYRHVIRKKHAHHLQESINEADESEVDEEGLVTKNRFVVPSREHSRNISENSAPSCERSDTAWNYPYEVLLDSAAVDSKKAVSSSSSSSSLQDDRSVNLTKTSKILDASDARFLKDLTFLIGSHTPNMVKRMKKRLGIAHKLGCAFYCYICDDSILDVKSAREHVSGRRHADSMQKYGCECIVTTKNGYYCNCCKRNVITLPIAVGHVLKGKHLRHLADSTRNSCGKEAPMDAPMFAKECSTTNGVETSLECVKSTPSCEKSLTALSATSPEVSCDYIVIRGKNMYSCRLCVKSSHVFDDARVHVEGRRHRNALKNVSCARAVTQVNGGHENGASIEVPRTPAPNLEVGSLENDFPPINGFEQHASSFKLKRGLGRVESAARFENEAIPRNTLYGYIAMKMSGSETLTDETNEADASEKIIKDFREVLRRKTNFEPFRIKTRCPICAIVVPDFTSLHCHLASHFGDCFVSATSERESRAIESSDFELDVDCESYDATEPPTLLEPRKPKSYKRKIKTAETLALLNFEKDEIYEMIDKTAEYALCSKLCAIIDPSTIYCLVCRETVTNTFQTFYDHLGGLDHCSYLEMMERDAARFSGYPDQFSDLDLALEYMEETSDESARCYACNVVVANETAALRAHVYDDGHSRSRIALRAGAARIAELLKSRVSCDWYRVQRYWCVPCRMGSSNEVNFVAHLESASHTRRTNERTVKGKALFLDHCTTCALLWYGYRVTRFYHERTSAHVVLARDGFNVPRPLSKFAVSLLARPEAYADARIRHLDEIVTSELAKQRVLLEQLEAIVRTKFPRARAYTFGSRIAGFGSENSDLDVFLDCRNFYEGNASKAETTYFIEGVHECLCKHPNGWTVDELLTSCKAPIIRVHHRETDLKCDLSFQDGLGVENTKIIRTYCDVYPPCRKLIIILRQWLAYCDLADSRIIKNYAFSWLVVFYLQSMWILPSIETLLKMKNKSQKIGGWEVGVSHDFAYYEADLGVDDSSSLIVQLLKGFFGFYADFDFRREVVCPLLGCPLDKRDFIETKNLPGAMKSYLQNLKVNVEKELFAMDSPMCVQDPFRLNDNLTKSVSKRHLNVFRICCAQSLNFLQQREVDK